MFRLHLLILLALAVIGASCAPSATPTAIKETVLVPQTVVVTVPPPPTVPAPPTSAPAPTATPIVSIPTIPAPVAVTLDAKTTTFLILDITSVICAPRKACPPTVPPIATLLKKARDAKVAVAYSDTATAGSTIMPEVAPLPDEPKVTGRADKFISTNLDDILKGKGIKTAVIVGSASNGAVLYTAFGANIRGYSVVVAEDGMSTDDSFAHFLTRYQLLNQPGFGNATNTPPQEGRVAVTLSRSDLITFK